MIKLIILYIGTIILAYLSQVYYPVHIDEHSSRRHFLHDRLDIFCVIIVVWSTLFNGLRISYNDTGNYIHFFNESAIALSEHFATSTETGLTDNPLYYIAQLFSKRLIDNYHVWFLITSFFNVYVVVKFLKHYSVSFPLTIVVYHAIGTYGLYLVAIKQSIAIAILLIALPYLLERKWLKYYILVFIAILFHTHSFLFLILPIFLTKPWTKITYISIAAVIFAMATYDYTLGAFMEYAQSIGANVAEVEVFDDMTVSPVRIAVYAIVPLITFLFKNRLYQSNNQTISLFSNMSILSCSILCIGLVNGANLFARMAGYFELGTALILPWALNKLFDTKSKSFIYIIAFTCFTMYYIFDFTTVKNFDSYRLITIWEFVRTLFQ